MSSKSPLITIITPTYNVEDSLEATIKSIIEQDYDNIEHIIVDGASTDGTLDIIKKYESKITKYVSEPDKGIYEAMNKGVNLATGSYINIMNSADTFTSKDTISKAVQIIKKKEIKGIYYGDANVVGKDSVKVKVSDPEFLYERMSISHQACFVHTDLYREFPFNETLKIASDFEFFHTMHKKDIPFINLNNIVTNFDTTGISNTHAMNGWFEVLGIIARDMQSEEELLNLLIVKLTVNKYLQQNYGMSLDIVERAANVRKELFKLKNVSFIKNPLKKYKLYKQIITKLK